MNLLARTNCNFHAGVAIYCVVGKNSKPNPLAHVIAVEPIKWPENDYQRRTTYQIHFDLDVNLFLSRHMVERNFFLLKGIR